MGRAWFLGALCWSAVASAQPAEAPPPPPPFEEPTECVTTTTVRCTGRAAHLAIPQAQVDVPPPAPMPPPMYYAPPPPQILLVPAPGNGWQLQRDTDGNLWRVRERRTRSNGMVAAGLSFFGGTYLITAVAGGLTNNYIAAMPFFGAFGAAVMSGGGAAAALYSISGLAQIATFVVGMVGLGAGPKRCERVQLYAAPMASAGTGGLAIGGRF